MQLRCKGRARLGACGVLLLGFWFDAVMAQPSATFSCPARISALGASLTGPPAAEAFSMSFPAGSPAHLLSVNIQVGQGADAENVKPHLTPQRWHWTLPADRKEPTTAWCLYEGGIALARPVASVLTQCTAYLGRSDIPRSEGEGGVAWGLGRVALSCL